jgi:uncharacterized protein YqgV (UPF0045/DUF77 family)
MSVMNVAVFPLDVEMSLGIGGFVLSLVLLSEEKRVSCKPTPSRAIFEKNKGTLLEILDEIDNSSFSTLTERALISVEFDGSREKALTRTQIDFLGAEPEKGSLKETGTD